MPKAEDLVRLDRRREAKRLSNTEWEGLADPDARLAELRDGRTHLAHKPGHAADPDTGTVVAADDQTAAVAPSIEPDHFGWAAVSSTGC